MRYLFRSSFGEATGLEGLWPRRGANIFYGFCYKEKGGIRGSSNRPFQEESNKRWPSSGTSGPTTL